MDWFEIMKARAVAVTVLALVAGAALGAEISLPHHKPGLWQNDILVGGKHTSNQQCFDTASEVAMLAVSKQHCSKRDVVHNVDGSWSTTGVCQFTPGVTQTSETRIKGDFNAKLTMTIQSTASTTTHATITSTWLGPCKPDQRGGDVITSSGAKVNMIDMMSGRPPIH
jgi:hypothetical protein